MATTKMTHFTIGADDKPGAWAHMLNTCKNENVDLAGLWGWGMQGTASFIAVPKDPNAFKTALQNAGMTAEEHTGFFIEVNDEVGALCDIANKISEAGINLRAVDAMSIGGKVGCYIFCNDADIDQISNLIG